jgi:hypothetical protein
MPKASKYNCDVYFGFRDVLIPWRRILMWLWFNLYEPCVLYIGLAHRYPPNTPFYIFFQQIYVLNFLNMLHTLRFFSLQNVVYFKTLHFLVPALFPF